MRHFGARGFADRDRRRRRERDQGLYLTGNRLLILRVKAGGRGGEKKLYISTPTRLTPVVPHRCATSYHCEPLPAVAACAGGGGPPLPPSTPWTVVGWPPRYDDSPPTPRPDAAWDAPELLAPPAAGPDPGAGLGRALRFPCQSKKLPPFAEGAPMGPCDPFVAPVGCA